MNIFILDTEHASNAKYHLNKHAVKMPLEHCQLLSTAHRMLDGEPRTGSLSDPEKNRMVYKATHKNHPCALWVRASASNYRWLVELTIELFAEYTFRYGKIHKSSVVFEKYLLDPPKNLYDCGLTPFAQAMPVECRDADPVQAYRSYYISHKSHIAFWKKREIPHWFMEKNECSSA